MRLRILAAVAAVGLLAAACSSQPGTGGSSSGAVQVELLSVQQPTETIPTILKALIDEFAKTHPGSSLKVTYVPQDQLDQKLQLLAAQDALPEMFFAPGTPTAQTEMAGAGKALNLEETLTSLGVFDKVDPTAAQIMRNQQGGKVFALPLELNIEGIWYNKKIFADNGIAVPTTWDELSARPPSSRRGHPAVLRLRQAGLAAHPAGQRLPVPDARSRTRCRRSPTGRPSSPTPSTSRPRRRSPTSARQGYFGDGVASIDYDPAVNEFLTGQGRDVLHGQLGRSATSTTPTQNKIGPGQHRLHAVPDRRRRQRLRRPDPGERRACRYGLGQGVQRHAATEELARSASPSNYGDVALNATGRRCPGFMVNGDAGTCRR